MSKEWLETCRKAPTPLHVAAFRGFADIVEVLMGLGELDAAVVNPDGDTALHLACAAGHVRYILPHVLPVTGWRLERAQILVLVLITLVKLADHSLRTSTPQLTQRRLVTSPSLAARRSLPRRLGPASVAHTAPPACSPSASVPSPR